MSTPPPLPPEPDWAPPPRSSEPHRTASDLARRAGVREARLAGVAAFLTIVAYVCTGVFASAAGGRALFALVVIGVAATIAFARRGWRAGLPPGEIAATVCLTALLALALSIGLAITVAFGACLIALGSSK